MDLVKILFSLYDLVIAPYKEIKSPGPRQASGYDKIITTIKTASFWV
jgi:hypothetical protein